jgi:hypothetical protein
MSIYELSGGPWEGEGRKEGKRTPDWEKKEMEVVAHLHVKMA